MAIWIAKHRCIGSHGKETYAKETFGKETLLSDSKLEFSNL